MDKEKIATIKVFQQEKETDELLTIWTEHDTNEWDEEAFIAVKEILLERGIDIGNNAREPTNEKVSLHIKNSIAGGFNECDVILDGEIIGRTGPEGGEFDLPNYHAGMHTLILSIRDSSSNVGLFETKGDSSYVKVEFEYGEHECDEDIYLPTPMGVVEFIVDAAAASDDFHIWLRYLGQSEPE